MNIDAELVRRGGMLQQEEKMIELSNGARPPSALHSESGLSPATQHPFRAPPLAMNMPVCAAYPSAGRAEARARPHRRLHLLYAARGPALLALVPRL